ncbi:MAG: ABC transporter permease [Muribaculaceae bacterium]|nr:ABC transporter permease [Muribaculaceae bacterium]
MKRDSIIKILSLGLGLTVGIILIGKIFYELSYDTGYKDSERINAIIMNINREKDSYTFPQVSGGVAPSFKAEIPAVEAATRTTWYGGNTISDEEGNEYPISSVAADNNFFEVFEQRIIKGNPKEILDNPDMVMVSESFAEILGGPETAMGKVLSEKGNQDQKFIIGGIYEDFKPYGSIKPDIIFSLNLLPESSTLNWEGNEQYKGYIKLRKGVDPSSLKDAIVDMQLRHMDMESMKKYGMDIWFTMESLPSLHRTEPKIKSGIIILSIVAFLIITVSLLNYILVVISALVRRSREMGIRKCYGAVRSSIYKMLFRESLWQIVAALALAGVLIFFGRNLIKDLTGYTFMELLVPQSILAIAIVMALVLSFSVIIPAIVYMKVPIAEAIRGYSENSRKWKVALLSVQVMVNIFIVCFIIIISLQYHKINTLNPGYDSDNIVYFRYYSPESSDYRRIIEALRKDPEIENVGVAGSMLFRGASGNNITPVEGDEDNRINIADLMPSTPEIFDIYNINFLEGRKPEKYRELAVSRKLVEKMQDQGFWLDGAVGKQLFVSSYEDNLFTVSGVFDNFLLGNLLYAEERPVIWPYGSLDHNNQFFMNVVIKLKEMSPDALKRIKDIVDPLIGDSEISVEVLREDMRHIYDESVKIRNVLLIGGLFSFLIALMGLIAFLNDESERRRKELAIRKINGATPQDIMNLFYTFLIKLSLASGVVGCIGAYVIGKDWLTQFSEQISLSPLIFIGGTFVILIIICMVALINGLRFLKTNPVEQLRTE